MSYTKYKQKHCEHCEDDTKWETTLETDGFFTQIGNFFWWIIGVPVLYFQYDINFDLSFFDNINLILNFYSQHWISEDIPWFNLIIILVLVSSFFDTRKSDWSCSQCGHR